MGCGFGGGYFGFCLWLLKFLFANRVPDGYFHPRDFDPRQPRLQGLVIKHFKTYVGLKGLS